MAEPKKIALQLFYHSAGQQAMFASEARYVIAPCGRRYGKTDGAFRKLVEFAVQAREKLLWVDTTQSNIEKYYNEKLEPLIAPLAPHFKWDKKLKVLSLWNGSTCHFGSAEKPENLEGFGYDRVFLNEAGHILGGKKGEKLWSATILPMTMEGRGGRGAQVFFVGTPKDIQYGPGLFRRMAMRGEDPGDADVETFRRSSYDNPYLTPSLIKEIFSEIRPFEVKQEVFGEFVDQEGRNMVVPYAEAMEALRREVPDGPEYHAFWGVDVARGGGDESALAKRRHLRLLEPVMTRHDLRDGNEVADWIAFEYNETGPEERPKVIFVDEIGYGSSVLDVGRRIGLPMVGVNVARRPLDERRFDRKRDELWFRCGDWVRKASLGGDEALARELVMVGFGYRPGTNRIKVESKDDLKRLGHASPNRADALNLTFEAGNELRTNKLLRAVRSRLQRSEGTWMSL